MFMIVVYDLHIDTKTTCYFANLFVISTTLFNEVTVYDSFEKVVEIFFDLINNYTTL